VTDHAGAPIISDAPATAPAQSASLRGGWSELEEALLVKAVAALNLRAGRSTKEQWDRVAGELARDGRFARRTGSSCRHRAVKLGVYQQLPPLPPPAPAPEPATPAQRSFGEKEAAHLIAAVLERIAEELRRA
jgi:hypothetical protein